MKPNDIRPCFLIVFSRNDINKPTQFKERRKLKKKYKGIV